MITADMLLERVAKRDPQEEDYHRAVESVAEALCLAVDRHPELGEDAIIWRMLEPERVIQFRVPWVDDDGQVHVNRGWRVEHCGALGPFKGGLRFRDSVNLGVLKMLAFEQVFKNALTGRPIGGAKGGADFHPGGRSDREVMAFCQAFMTSLFRYLGPATDVPAGDIGVGAREIGYLFGQYRRLTNRFEGALTGKKPDWGGAPGRDRATGFGLVAFVREMLREQDREFEGRTVAISGAGNVALAAAERSCSLGGRVITLSDSNGFVVCEAGFDAEQLAWIRELKDARRGRLAEVDGRWDGVRYAVREEGAELNPQWALGADIALPCATQYELGAEDAGALIDGGVVAVAEGANMPCTPQARRCLQDAEVAFGPAKAANAGGVAVSALEMSQNAQQQNWAEGRVLDELDEIMAEIHARCRDTAEEFGREGDLALGADIAAFRKVGHAVLEQGVV